MGDMFTEFVPLFTLCLVGITVLISWAAFSDQRVYDKLIMWPARMHDPKEIYRLLSSGFIHADWMHLALNMLALYIIGGMLEEQFILRLGFSPWAYMLLYVSGVVISSLPDYFRKRNNFYFRSLGASGGVATVIFANIYIEPWARSGFLFNLPNIAFGAIYLAASAYMSRRGAGSRVNHDAHIWGAIYGFIFMIVMDVTNLAANLDFMSAIRQFRH